MSKSSGGIRSGFSSIILRESQRRTTKTASQKIADVIDEIERGMVTLVLNPLLLERWKSE